MASRVQTMSFLFWNVQGLGDTDKCGLVRDSISAAAPAVACLQESKLATLDGHKARSFLPVALSEFLSKDADGTRGGVITAWDPRLLTLVDSTRSRFSLTTSFVSAVLDIAFSITNVYAPADHSLTGGFVADMHDLSPSIQGPRLIVGDFNLIRLPREKNNDRFDAARAAPLTP